MGKGHAAFPIPFSYGFWVVSEPLWGCVFLYINLVPQTVLGSEGRDTALYTQARATENHWCIGILAPFLCGFHQFIRDLVHWGAIFRGSRLHPVFGTKATAQSPNLNPRDLWGLRLVKVPNHLHSGWAHGFVLAQNHRLVWGSTRPIVPPTALGFRWAVGQQ